MKAYDAIASALLAMTDDAGNWQPCWHRANLTMPVNRLTKATYRGANTLMLWVTAMEKGYACNQWATFKQWLELGQCVKKGEKGTPIVYFGTHVKDGEDGEKKGYRFGKTAWVFNIAQVAPLEGGPVLGMPATTADLPDNPDDRIANAEAFARATGAQVWNSEETFTPCYVPAHDRIMMPLFKDFHSAEAYYSVLLHELTHWTGSPKRLARETLIHYQRNRALEELTAELGAAFLCADLGISAEPRKDHADYIASWKRSLTDEPDAFMRAVSAASAAAEYLHSLQQEERAAA